MFIRIVKPHLKAGMHNEAAKRWAAFLGPKAKQNPMFRGGYFASTSDGSSSVAVTLWDKLPDAAATDKMRAEIMAELQDFTAGPPQAFDEYEVHAQI